MNCFGQKLPLILTLILSATLAFHVLFEMSGTECKEVVINNDGNLTIVECERSPFSLKNMIETIVSDGVRNLGLLLAASIGWFFLYWRAKIADQSRKADEQSAEATKKNAETAEHGLTTERLTRAIEQLASEKVSIRIGDIRSLEQIADTHKEERTKIIQILSARICELAPVDYTKMESDKELRGRHDIVSAIEVLAKVAEPFGEKR